MDFRADHWLPAMCLLAVQLIRFRLLWPSGKVPTSRARLVGPNLEPTLLSEKL
ncbi:hypothetical protein [Mesorhizobium sp.]|uniref:hypothetical protein n=1 Tax=Mesorhizobium sp. TaxID=1871066 RepID=UPI00257BE411|nr:hypothetical protein [Mesorhizobium sp.]